MIEVRIDPGGPVLLTQTGLAIDRFLLSVLRNWKDSGVWDAVRTEIYKKIEEHFNSEGGGRGWPPLSDNYERWKRRTHPGKRMLELSGDLKDAATGKSGNSVWKPEAGYLEYGIMGIPYAAVHQTGGKRIPMRRYLDIEDDEWDELRDKIKEYLMQKFGGMLPASTLGSIGRRRGNF